jgi:hypothetical protein
MGKTATMPRPKKNKDAADRHKPRKMVGIREQFIAPGDILAHRLGMGFSEMVNQAVREKLERDGLWPPKERGSQQ